MSVCLWFTLLTTPAIMVFESLNDDLKYLLWLNESFWIVDIARKLVAQQKPGQDPFDAAIEYIKSTLILDIISTLPQVASAMNPTFTVFKNVRLY
jgi:hypothetical protein